MKVELPFQPSRSHREVRDRTPKPAVFLVLGHLFERLITQGLARDYSDIARITGLSRARVTRLANLTLLAPNLQEEILLADRDGPIHTMPERLLRSALRHVDWQEQRRFCLTLPSVRQAKPGEGGGH